MARVHHCAHSSIALPSMMRDKPGEDRDQPRQHPVQRDEQCRRGQRAQDLPRRRSRSGSNSIRSRSTRRCRAPTICRKSAVRRSAPARGRKQKSVPRGRIPDTRPGSGHCRKPPHMGAFPSSDVISFFELQLAILASRFEPCSRPGGFPTSSNSHTVAVFCNGCTKIPISSGKGSGGRDPSSHRRLRPYLTSVRPAWIFQD